MVTLVANKDPELFDKVRKELEYMTALKDIMMALTKRKSAQKSRKG